MIDHNLTHLSNTLTENQQGEMTLPFEKGNKTMPASLREFVILARRTYSPEAVNLLADSEGFAVTDLIKDDNKQPFFHLLLKVSPNNQSLREFMTSQGDSFFDTLIQMAGRSSKRKISGNRAAWVSEFRNETTADGKPVWVADVLISRSIFFNDYRVSINYPSSEKEYSDFLDSWFESLIKYFDVKVAIEINSD